MKRIYLLSALFFLTAATAFAQPLTVANNVQNIKCPGDCNGIIDVTVTGGVPPYTYQWGNGATWADLFGLCQPGTYTVTVADAQGTTATTSATVTGPQNGATGISVTPACCFGSCTGKIDIGVGSGTYPLTYLWSNGSTAEPLTNLCAGTYTPTVTDANGCIIPVGSFTVGQPAQIILNASVINAVGGYTGAIDLTVTGGIPVYTYTWSNGKTNEDQTGLLVGAYCVTVTDAKGCTATTCTTVQYTAGSVPPPIITGVVKNSCGTGQTNCSGAITPTVLGQGGYVYSWVGPNGFTSSTAILSNICNGTYTLIVADFTGTTASASYTIYPSGSADPLTILSSNPAFCNATAGTGGKCEQLCPNARVTYFVNAPSTCNSASGPVPNYAWAVNGAESWSVTPDKKQVNVVWGKSGSGDISVVDNNGGQCTISGIYCVNILEEPTAKFSTTPALAAPADTLLEICKGQSVAFKNQSLAADLYEWTFSDDASVATEQHPKHTYNQPGLFSVRLIARTNCLCADTTWLRVRVLDAETPLLDCVNTLCPGEVITYSTPSTCASYEWAVSPNGLIIGGGGLADDSVTVRWLTGPDGTLSLRAIGCGSNVCPSTAVVQVPILSDQAEIRGPELVCPDAEETYQITAFDGAFFKWTINPADGTLLEGDGTPRVSVKWGKASPAKRPLIVEYYNCYLGCFGRDTILVKVSPQFGIVGPVQGCDNSTAVFNTKTFDNQNITCEWTFYAPDGTVAHQFVSPNQKYTAVFGFGPGTYRLVAKPVAADQQKTCTSEAEWKVLVQANPQKPFSISGQALFCPNQLLTFKAEGVSPLNDIRWQVMPSNGTVIDGGTGNPKNFSFNGGAGQRWVAAYQITTDALACKSDTVRLLVKELATVNVSGPDGVCANEVATYTAPLYVGFDYQWNIIPAAAGIIVKGQKTNTLEVQWVKPGSGSAELTVCGKKASKNTAIFLLPEPVATYPDGLCPGTKANVATVDAYPTYSWQTPSGKVLSAAANPSFGPGSYLVSVTDANGCKGSTDFQIDTFPVPNLTITTSDPTGFCNNERYVNIKALTTQDADYQYEWFRDGTPLGLNQNTLVTNQYGNYSCRATNAYGCSATAGTINIFEFCGGVSHNPSHKPRCEPGDVSYQILPTARCDSFQFKVIGGPLYPPGTATWHFAESGSSYHGSAVGDQAQFKFSNAGQYIVVLYAVLINGAQCIVLDSLDVDAVARFSVKPACIGDSTRFQDATSFLPDKSIASWTWELADPITPGPDLSTARNPAHPYALPGSNVVRLTVTAASGCTSTFSKNTDIQPLPNDAFATLPAVCAGNATPFTWGEPVTGLTWNFGEAASGAKNTSTGSPTYHTYATAGTYTVTAVPRNAWGCTATYSRPISIVANNLVGSITPAAPAQICEGKTLDLIAPAVAGATYEWSTGVLAPSITVTETGVYRVTVTTADGCRLVPPARSLTVNPAPDGTIKALEINSLGQVTGVSFPSLTVCEGTDVNLKVESNSTYNFSWSGGGTDDELLFVKVRNNLLGVGTHTYSVTVTNPVTGCTAVTAPFTVVVNPTPSGFAATAATFCAGTPSEVKYTGTTPLPSWSLLWNNGEVGPAFTTSEAGKYFVRVINEFGCAANSLPVVIRPGPNVAALPGGCHSRCKPDKLCLPPLPDIASWQWYLNGSPIPGATSSQFTAQVSGTYWAVLTDTSGCKAQSKNLYLDLYDGFGTISGKVWSDVNGNGIIDAADTLLAAIPLIFNQNGLPYATAQSAPTGSFALPNVLSTAYSVLVDAAKLSPLWEVVIGQRDLTLTGCGASAEGDLLLHRRDCLPAQSELQFTACPGAPIVYNGVAVPAGTSESFTLTTLLGCDSVVTVNVAALPILTSELNVAVCPGSIYTYAGLQVPANTTQDFMLKTAAGCDSIVTVNVAELSISASTLNVKICPGTTYAYAGTDLPIGASQSFNLKNAAGCDSLVTVHVTGLPLLASTLDVKVCPGTTYAYAGTDLPIGASQSFNLKNAAGCDSLVTVSVTGLPLLASTLNVKVCPGTTYAYAGTDLPIGASQSFNLKNAAGCDSLVTVSVTGLPLLTSTLNVKVCPGTTYAYAGTNLPIGASQSFNLKNAAGCDSLVTVSVAALPVSASILNVKACPGSSYTYAGTQIPTGTSQMFQLKNWLGCDSAVTVTVAPLPISVLNLAVKTCPGSTYRYAGVDLPVGASQNFTFKNWQNCDSIVTVTVGELPVSTSSLVLKTCPGSTVAYGGSELQVGAAQSFTFQNYLGCDSMVAVTVTALPVSASSLTLKTCPGTTIAYGGANLQVGAAQSFTFQNYLGCDSMVAVTVTALPVSASSLTLKTCPGSTIAYGGANLGVGATQNFTFQNWQGCDSVVAVTVAALPVSASSLTLKTCPGSTIAYGGANLGVGATQNFTLQNWQGCDSVVAVTVAALPVSASVLNVKVCPGATYAYAGVSLAAGETRDFYFQNWLDCDSVVTVSVSAWPDLSFVVGSVKSCATVPNGGLSALNLLGGSPPLAYSLDGAAYQSSPDFAALAPGNYTLRVRDSNGCIFEETTSIEEYGGLEVALPDAALACGEASVRLEPEVSGDLTGLAFVWSSGATSTAWEATEAGKVWVEVSNVCQKIRREAVVHWGDLSGDTSLVYMANVFMPVGGLVENSTFRAHFAANVTVLSYSLDVFDRWGNMVFRSEQPEVGWDGVFRTQLSDGDVYPWLLQARVLYCGREISIFERGDVTTVR